MVGEGLPAACGALTGAAGVAAVLVEGAGVASPGCCSSRDICRAALRSSSMSTSSAGADGGASCCCGGWAEVAGWAAGAGVSAASACELSAIRGWVLVPGVSIHIASDETGWPLSHVKRVRNVSMALLGLVVLLLSGVWKLACLDPPFEVVQC